MNIDTNNLPTKLEDLEHRIYNTIKFFINTVNNPRNKIKEVQDILI